MYERRRGASSTPQAVRQAHDTLNPNSESGCTTTPNLMQIRARFRSRCAHFRCDIYWYRPRIVSEGQE